MFSEPRNCYVYFLHVSLEVITGTCIHVYVYILGLLGYVCQCMYVRVWTLGVEGELGCHKKSIKAGHLVSCSCLCVVCLVLVGKVGFLGEVYIFYLLV